MNYIATTLNDYLKEQQLLNNTFIAYHGSGNDFGVFSNDFIGSGIGNDGYGYGIYLTDSKQEAKNWATSLEKTSKVLIDGIKQSDVIEKFLTNVVSLHGNKSELLLHILKIHLDNLYKEGNITIDEYDFIKKSNKLKLVRSRIIYEVKVNGGDFIQWKQPITNEQINKIKNKSIEEKNTDILVGDVLSINNKIIRNGEDLYLSLKMSNKDKSNFLNRCGICGIIYYENATNYVIFDSNDISIIKKTRF